MLPMKCLLFQMGLWTRKQMSERKDQTTSTGSACAGSNLLAVCDGCTKAEATAMMQRKRRTNLLMIWSVLEMKN